MNQVTEIRGRETCPLACCSMDSGLVPSLFSRALDTTYIGAGLCGAVLTASRLQQGALSFGGLINHWRPLGPQLIQVADCSLSLSWIDR